MEKMCCVANTTCVLTVAVIYSNRTARWSSKATNLKSRRLRRWVISCCFQHPPHLSIIRLCTPPPKHKAAICSVCQKAIGWSLLKQHQYYECKHCHMVSHVKHVGAEDAMVLPCPGLWSAPFKAILLPSLQTLSPPPLLCF